MPLPDTQTKDHAIETLKNLSRDGFGTSDKPFFVAVGFHKPHLPFVSPAKFFDMCVKPHKHAHAPTHPHMPLARMLE
jgi:iduronate 2-sulfatase